MRLLSFVGSLVVALLSFEASADTRFALIVGHNLGQPNETPLRWAESDATQIHGVLTTIGNVDGSRATLILGASSDGIRQAWQEIAGRMKEAQLRGERTMLLFYYSGHASSEELHLGTEKYSIAELMQALRGGPADTVVAILDACRSDARMGRSRGAKRSDAFAWPVVELNPEGFVLLTSAAKGEPAQESDDLESGLFTHHLLSGMLGGADSDNDGSVSLEELYRFSYGRTLEETHRRQASLQHSELEIALSGRGTLTLTYPKRALAAIELSDDTPGNLLVIDDQSGRVVSEIFRPDPKRVRLAVPAGRYRIHVRSEESVKSGVIVVHGGVRRIEASELSAQPARSAFARGLGHDPSPNMIFVGAALHAPAISGFSTGALHQVSSGSFAYARRIGPTWRLGGALSIGYAGADNELWRFSQTELTLNATADYLVELSSWFAIALSARAGATGVVQHAERKSDALVSVDLDRNTAAFGPRLGCYTGVELTIRSTMVLRAGVEAAAWMIRAGDQLELRRGFSGTIELGFRL